MGIKITIPNSSSDVLTFGSGNTPTAAQIAGIDSGSSNGQLALYTTASGTSTERVRINASGNVGIGTDSPAAKLHVDSTTSGQMARFNSTAANGGYITGYSSGTGVWDLGTAIQAFATGSSTDVGLTSRSGFLGFGTASIERMRIDTSGNLLVGATTKYGSEKFNVTQSAAAGGILIRLSGGPYNNTSYAMVEGRDGTTTRFYFPSNGGLYNYSANNFNLASDLRLKKDIQPVQSYWNVFKSIEWKTWLYNDQTDEIKNIGVIAQELQALAPELVCESNALPTPEGESPYLGLWENDFKMAGMSVITELVKRCEEQQAIITSLTDRLTALENK